jgi:hypothetical protein
MATLAIQACGATNPDEAEVTAAGAALGVASAGVDPAAPAASAANPPSRGAGATTDGRTKATMY